MSNANSENPLHEAARFGRMDAVKKTLETDQNLHLIMARNSSGETPFYVAAANGNKDVFDYLLKRANECDYLAETVHKCITESREDGCTVLHAAVMGQYYGIALSILESYPELGGRRNKKGITALYLLACSRTSFKSGTKYGLKNLCTSPFIPWRIVTLIIYYFVIPSPFICESKCYNTDKEDHKHNKRILGSFLYKLYAGYVRLLKALPFFKRACEAKERHVYAEALAKTLVDGQKQWSHPAYNYYEDQSHPDEHYEDQPYSVIVQSKGVPNPLVESIKNNIMELVKMIICRFPDAANTLDKENKRNILHIAVETKDAFMYEYLKHKVAHKDKMLEEVDCHGNTVLHLAANISDETSKPMYSPTIGMAWDVFWYKHVKQDTPQSLIDNRNDKGLTAKEIFKEGHSILLKEAQKDVKDVNDGLMLVSVLISTINFAAIFTLPGSFDQDTGQPLLFKTTHIKSKQLSSFFVFIGVSLLASLIALGTQLSIQLSQFRKNDFYFVMPFKIFCATTSLYYATTFSITACFQAYILEGALKNNSSFFTLRFRVNIFEDALKNDFFMAMVMACIPAALVYMDVVFAIMNYLYFTVWYRLFAIPRQAYHSFMSFLKRKTNKGYLL